MRFPNTEALTVPATLCEVVPGSLHRDGSRYLPLLIFELRDGFRLAVVDRHHVVDQDDRGRLGVARLVWALCGIRLQPPGSTRQGLMAGPRGGPSSNPTTWGRIDNIITWEHRQELGYHTIYTELCVDIGIGTIGVRTNLAGPDLLAVLGGAALQPGDWISLERSRIDILAFIPNTQGGPSA